jgi:hypothetical protein
MKDLSKLWGIVFLTAIALAFFSCVEGFDSEQPAAKPTATPAGGSYTSVQIVTLATKTKEAVINYTLDGTDPTASMRLLWYSSPLIISETTTLKAYAHDGGGSSSSEILTETYTITLPSFTSITDVSNLLASLPSNTRDNPVSLPININLGTMTAEDSGWQQLLDVINTAGKYVNLDLSACTMSGISFNPNYRVATGKDKILSLILPTAATSIEGGRTNYSAFRNFTNLKSISGTNIITISESAFSDRQSLQSVDFPKATSINNTAFAGCVSLQNVNLPKVTDIGYYAFEFSGATLSITMGSTAPTLGLLIFNSGAKRTVTVKVPAGATGYTPFTGSTVTINSGTDENWANGLRGGGWDGTKWATNGGTSYINQNITVIIERQ